MTFQGDILAKFVERGRAEKGMDTRGAEIAEQSRYNMSGPPEISPEEGKFTSERGTALANPSSCDKIASRGK